MNKKSKIFVAGHRGLVGSSIVNALRNKGFSNLVLRTRQELDLKDIVAVRRFFDAERPEYVVLAAAKVGGILANNTYRGEFIYDNLMIQNNVIHQSYLHKVKKLLFLGSTCIYPKNCPQPMREDYMLTDVLEYTNEPYAIAKIAGIKLCESYNIQYGTNFISVMPTNLYGPNDNFDLEKSHVLPALMRKIHLGKALEKNDWEAIDKDLNYLPIEGVDASATTKDKLAIIEKYGVTHIKDQVTIGIWGSGKPMREFLWSEDLADACIFLMQHRDFNEMYDQKTKEIRNSHINIGTGKDISIQELAQKIKEIIGFKGEFHFNRDKPDGTFKKLTDSTKLQKLGWRHQVALDHGIELLYHWYCSKH